MKSILPALNMDPVSKLSEASSSLIMTSRASDHVNVVFSLRGLRSVLSLINSFLLLLLSPFQLHSHTILDKSKDNRDDCKVCSVLQVVTSTVSWRNGSFVTRTLVPGDNDSAVRRALAIKRVTHDHSNGSAREYSLFSTARGDSLFTQCWSPTSIKVRGLVIILHGLNEHSGRYDIFAKQLNAHGYRVYGMDWIGHGGSDGLHGFVHSLDAAVEDFKAFLQRVVAENSGLPCFLFGHSTGAAIIVKASLDPEVERLTRGFVATSPAIRVQPSHPVFGFLAPVFSLLLPTYQFSGANKPGLPVSRDPDALVAKYSDPLVYTGSIRIRTGAEILRLTSHLQQNIFRLRHPFLVLHGTADTITDPVASQQLYKMAASRDKSLKLYDGFLHDLLFEPEKVVVVHDIIDWLNMRVLI